MKKIALLFTILCAGMLNGMEPEQGRFKGWGDLLPEMKVMVIQTLNTTYDDQLSSQENLKNIIAAIKATRLVDTESNKIITTMYGDQSGFMTLAHILAKELNTSTYNVAKEFKTNASQKYLDLGTQLANAIRGKDNAKVAELIIKGADVNFMENPVNMPLHIKYRGNTLLITAIMYQNSAEVIKLLLDKGANPNLENHIFEPLLNKFKKSKYSEDASKIRTLLEEARKK